MTEAEAKRLLGTIRDLALLGYPLPKGSPPINSWITRAFGEVAGICSRALTLSGTGMVREPTEQETSEPLSPPEEPGASQS